MLPIRASVNLGAMAMKGYSVFPKSSSITGILPSDCLVSYPGHSLQVSLTPLPRNNQYIQLNISY